MKMGRVFYQNRRVSRPSVEVKAQLSQTYVLAPIDAPTDVVVNVNKDNTVDAAWTGPSLPNGPIKVCILSSVSQILGIYSVFYIE